jgi:hypothetical protein
MQNERLVFAADLSPGELIRVGGWHPRYARILRVERDGDAAFVLVDGNGDGAELEAEAWLRTAHGWSCTSSVGFGPLDGSGWLAGASTRLVYAAGRAEVGTMVAVEFRHERHEARADEHGIWAFARCDDDTPADELPSELPRVADSETRRNNDRP